MRKSPGGRIAASSLLLLLVLAGLAPAAQGQSCAMCAATAAQTSAQGKHALNVGILFLLAPTLAIFCGVFFFVWRSKEPPNSAQALTLTDASRVDWERVDEKAEENEEALPSWANEKS
jgi:hypothetical protein